MITLRRHHYSCDHVDDGSDEKEYEYEGTSDICEFVRFPKAVESLEEDGVSGLRMQIHSHYLFLDVAHY
jgi:hypothetical protein